MSFIVSLSIAALLFIILISVNISSKKEKQSVDSWVKPLFTILISMFCFLAFTKLFVIVPAGSVGVIDTFGVVSDNTIKSGFNLRNPLSKIVPMSVKTQEIKEEMEVPSKEGLSIKLESSLLFHLDPNKANEIYRTVGANYDQILILPQFRSITRGVTSLYDAKALYTSQRDSIALLLLSDLKKTLEPRGIFIENVPLRKITLPTALHDAIEAKLSMEQQSQQMDFVIAKERKEADRKAIEAQGISNFQKIVSQGISDNLLKWKGIEATEKLAASSNSKMIVIGGKDGMPLIMNP